MKLGEKIKILREIKGIPPKEMADELGLSPSGYLKIERNEVDINTEKIEKISNKLGIKPHELLMDEKYVFNDQVIQSVFGQFHTVNFPVELKGLYEDKIKLQEEKIRFLEEKIRFLENGGK